MATAWLLTLAFLAAQVSVSEDDDGTTVDVHAGPVHVRTEDDDDDDDDHRHVYRNSRHEEEYEYIPAPNIIRIGKLLGTSVRNPDRESIGEIEDVAVDPDSGRIRYAAVSAGGFLGMGDKLIAVPWHAFRWVREDGVLVAVLNIEQEKLDDIEGFDEDHWPDVADPHWQRRTDRLFPLLPRIRDDAD